MAVAVAVTFPGTKESIRRISVYASAVCGDDELGNWGLRSFRPWCAASSRYRCGVVSEMQVKLDFQEMFKFDASMNKCKSVGGLHISVGLS